MKVDVLASVAKLPPARDRKNMDEKSMEYVMRVLQAHTVAVSALLQTHPDQPLLRTAFETIASHTAADPQTLATLRKAIR
jgi:hypothetical protein